MAIIEEFVNAAKKQAASDLHIIAGIPPRIRVNGELCSLDYPGISAEDVEGMLNQIIPSHFRAMLEKQGETEFTCQIGTARCRVNVFLQQKTPAIAVRMIRDEIPKVEELGIPFSVVELTKKKQGLVFVTGAHGSGKTTTIAALIDKINTERNVSIITIENPIEYLYGHKKSMVSQREIGADATSCTKALRAALREDADVILAGELRDADSVLAALTAAEAGCLVFAVLHTFGVVPTLNYIMDLFSGVGQDIRPRLASVIEAVVSQQLIAASDDAGRVGAFEVMCATDTIRNLIREAKTSQIDSLIQSDKKFGMQGMDDAVYQLYLERKIDADKAILAARNPETIAKRIL